MLSLQQLNDIEFVVEELFLAISHRYETWRMEGSEDGWWELKVEFKPIPTNGINCIGYVAEYSRSGEELTWRGIGHLGGFQQFKDIELRHVVAFIGRRISQLMFAYTHGEVNMEGFPIGHAGYDQFALWNKTRRNNRWAAADREAEVSH